MKKEEMKKEIKKVDYDFVIHKSVKEICFGVVDKLDLGGKAFGLETEEGVYTPETLKSIKKAFLTGRAVLIFREDNSSALSPFYTYAVDQAGIQHKMMGEYVENFPIQEIKESSNGLISETKEVSGYLVENVYSLQLNGMLGYIKNSSLVSSLEIDEIDRNILHAVKVDRNNTVVDVLELTYSSVAQTRKGDSDAIVIKSGTGLTESNSVELSSKINYSLRDFAVENASGYKLKLDKAFTRTRVANSSSKEIKLWDEYVFEKTSTRSFKITEEGGSREVVATLYHFTNGKVHMVLPEDFTVTKEHSIHVGEFDMDGEGAPKMTSTSLKISAPKTDGIAYMAKDLSERIHQKLNGKDGFYSAVQFRMTTYAKGLLLSVPDLEKELGVELVLFGGAVKAGIDRFYRENQLNFAVLNVNRTSEIKAIGRLSSQAYRNLLDTPDKARIAYQENKEIWKKVSELDREYVLAELRTRDFDEDGNLVEDQDTDELIRRLVNANVDLTLASGATRSKLLSYLKGKFIKVKRGQFTYLNDAQYSYLTVDPISVINYMKKGVLGLDFSDKAKGLMPDKTLIPVAKEVTLANGRKAKVLAPFEGAVGCVRYPMLHKEESRLVQGVTWTEGFYGESEYLAHKYNVAIKQGFFEGCQVFSLWDMNPEGMSGADFDGDICLSIMSDSFTGLMEQQPLFLDYSIVVKDGVSELVSGCPFHSVGDAYNLRHQLSESQIDTLQKSSVDINFPTVLFRDKELADNNWEELEPIIDKLSRLAMVQSLTGNDIGPLTNKSATITEAKQVAEMDLLRAKTLNNEGLVYFFSEEVAGFENLEFFMAMAIRWEIDKAKHGGAFREELPFIDMLMKKGVTATQIEETEKRFEISLERLFSVVNYK